MEIEINKIFFTDWFDEIIIWKETSISTEVTKAAKLFRFTVSSQS